MTGINERFEHKPTAFGLSKSRIAAFKQCPLRLWLQVHSPQVAAGGQDSAQLRLPCIHLPAHALEQQLRVRLGKPCLSQRSCHFVTAHLLITN